MRRAEFNIEDIQSIKEVLQDCNYATLSLVDGNKPYCVALNFVCLDEAIFFHGSSEGKKIDLIQKNNNCAFLAVKPYSIIPSYFFDTIAACPATQFFASVFIEGELSFLKDANKKATVLNALMAKLQKDGGYEPISYHNPIYTKMIDKTTIIELKPQNISCKIKVGQNLSDEKRENLIEKLNLRALDIDIQTIKEIKARN